MTQLALVRHPLLASSELPGSYMLRLCEANGLPSASSIYPLAGSIWSKRGTAALDVENLAALTRNNVSDLMSKGFGGAQGAGRWRQLLDHRLSAVDLCESSPRLCVHCVQSIGYIDVQWNLAVMFACPIHKSPALKNCPTCKASLRWNRPGLLTCHCGSPLWNSTSEIVLPREASLLDVVRCKIHSLPLNDENPERLPLDSLSAMNLRSLLTLIRILGRTRCGVQGLHAPLDTKQIMKAASEVLASWPDNFYQMLRGLGEAIPTSPSTASVRKQFGRFYGSIFKNGSLSPPTSVAFLKSAFVAFANDWERGLVDRRLGDQFDQPTKKRYLSQAEFAKLMGVDARTAARFLRDHTAGVRRTSDGETQRVIVDTAQVGIAPVVPGRILREREAARQLSLSVTLLRALKTCGIFEVHQLRSKRAGFHEDDISIFRKRLLELFSQPADSTPTSDSVMTLKAVVQGRHDPTSLKTLIVESMLKGRLAVVANLDGTIGGLALDLKAYNSFIRGARTQAASASVPLIEVAKILGCDPGTVPELVRRGLLTGRFNSVGLRVSIRSLEQFQKLYICLAPVARSKQTSTRSLMRKCSDAGVDLLLVATKRKGGPQPFALIKALMDAEILGQPGIASRLIEVRP